MSSPKLQSTDFDEYDYLEKTVEELEDRNGNPRDRERGEKSEKSYRKRESKENGEDEERRSKRSRGEEERSSRDKERHRSGRDRDGDRELERERDRRRERSSREKSKDREREKDGERERDRVRERSHREREKSKDRDVERAKSRDRDVERAKSRDIDRGREKSRDMDRGREKSRDRDRDLKDREREKSRDREVERELGRHGSRRSRSHSRRHEIDRDREKELIRERERELEMRDSRRFKEKKEVTEPEADPERDQRTVFAYQMPLKATERDVYEFFSKAGKVRDVRLIMDRNSRRSKGVGYIEFYDAMSVPMAIALSGQLLLGQPVMVKPSEAEKNLVQSNASGGASGGMLGLNGAVDRKLYVGNLHFNMTETQLREIFSAFGPVELVQLPLDLETGQCKGFGFVQFVELEHAKAAQSLNGTLEIAGRTLKVSSVTDHVGAQEPGAKSADFDDDDGGGLALNAQSRALLMQKLDRTGIATSMAGSLGVPGLNGAAPNPQAIGLPINGQAGVSMPTLPAQAIPSTVLEPVGTPSECLLLKNMFDPATETEPEFDLDIKEDVEEECSKYGQVKHVYVDKSVCTQFIVRNSLIFEYDCASVEKQRWPCVFAV